MQVFMSLSAIFPTCHFEFVLRDACVRSNFPINCGCLVVAHFSVILKNCVNSAKTVELKAVPLSVISVVCKFACLVIISMMTFATLIADASVKW